MHTNDSRLKELQLVKDLFQIEKSLESMHAFLKGEAAELPDFQAHHIGEFNFNNFPHNKGVVSAAMTDLEEKKKK